MRFIFGLAVLGALAALFFLLWKHFDRPAPPWPATGLEHPFADTVSDLTVSPSGAPSPRETPPAAEEATDVRTLDAAVAIGGRTINVTLEATPEVPDIALENLAATLVAVPFTAANRDDLKNFWGEKGKLLKGAAEVRLPAPQFTSVSGGSFSSGFGNDQRVSGVYFGFPDNWTIVRPRIIRLDPSYPLPRREEESGGDVGVATAALTGSWSGVRGTLACQPPDEPSPFPLPFVGVTINGQPTNAQADGTFEIAGPFTEISRMEIRYDGRVAASGAATVGPRMSVMNDFHNPRPEHVDITDGVTDPDGFFHADINPLSSLDCELFALGADALQRYHNITGTDPSAADDLRIKRWTDIHDGTPHTYYDYVAIANNFRSWDRSSNARRETIYHEFGHSLRHADDGDLGHWGWDNFRWAYARNHNGTEIFSEHYAFNEGWGQFWSCTRAASASTTSWTAAGDCLSGITLSYPHTDLDRHPRAPTGAPLPDIDGQFHEYLDWVELLIGRRLFLMSQEPGVGFAGMARVSRGAPGAVHTLREFENRYCTFFRDNAFCRSGRPVRAKAECPPNYHDDGAFCRLANVKAKPSYGRGAGEVPTICSGERDAGLCYQECREGFDGVGPVCWRRCPAGMTDDGAFCRRDVDIRGSDNSRCPWYDACGLTFERGCSTCPAGFQNDGCTCRRDAWIFAKESYGRGAGTVSTDCGPGRDYDGGLCYPRCRDGFNGVGPVCWGTCEAGYDDHGGTCYRDPQTITKY